MKKLFVKILGIIGSLAIVAGTITPVSAAPYTYTVTFRSGAQGTFLESAAGANGVLSEGNTVLTITGLNYGDQVTFSNGIVKLNDEVVTTVNDDGSTVDTPSADTKYYVKGIRESGKDNNTISASSFRVTSDMDYVVGYALKKDVVAYTVNYVDKNGEKLAPSETHYGNVGDKPVIAYLFLNGYLPQAYNLTGTLKADKDNEFTFVYTLLTDLPDIYRGYRDLGTIDNSGVIVIPGNGGNGGNGANGGAGGNGGAGANGGNGADGGVNIDDGNTPAAGPADIIDIDDEQSALANGNILQGLLEDNGISTESPTAFFATIPLAVKIAVTAGLVAVVAAAAYFLFIRKAVKKKND